MEWMSIIGNSIQYIEEHITENISTDGIARAVNVSPFYFQKGFAMLLRIYGRRIHTKQAADACRQ